MIEMYVLGVTCFHDINQEPWEKIPNPIWKNCLDFEGIYRATFCVHFSSFFFFFEKSKM